jgi:hypothetical protein
VERLKETLIGVRRLIERPTLLVTEQRNGRNNAGRREVSLSHTTSAMIGPAGCDVGAP